MAEPGSLEIRDVAPGLWLWQLDHPDWNPGLGWEPRIASFAYAAEGGTVLVDALAPPDEADEFWSRLERDPPHALVVMKPDHVRSVDFFVERYGVPAHGPGVFHRTDVPRTELEQIEPGSALPGGARALYDGRGRNETPLWLPEQRTLVFADGMTGADGELRIWETPHIDRARAALRELLELPFEYVIVAHGEPLHDRAAFERALELPPWS